MDALNQGGEQGFLRGTNFEVFGTDAKDCVGFEESAREEIHGGFADESGDEAIGGSFVDFAGRGELLNLTGVENGDAFAKSEGFFMVVRDVEERAAIGLVEFDEFVAQAQTEIGRKAGERFVHQERGGFANECAADRDALGFAAGEVGRMALQEGVEIEKGRDGLDAGGDFGARDGTEA